MAERRAELYEFLEKYLGCMKENAVRMMDEPMPEADEELFSLFEKTGNRLRYEEVYFLRRKYLAVFGCLSILDGGEAYVKKLAGVLRGICGEECWALPAHVHRDTDPDWRICVDLFASETAQALAEIVSLAGERLPEDVRRLVRENVFHRVLEPFANRKPPYPPWEGAGHNWNAVCAGSIGCAAICLMREEPERLEPLLERLLMSLPHYLEGFSWDGACMEGLDYFTYGFGYYVAFADMLYRYTGGKTDLLAQENCHRIALFQQKCYFPSGRTVSFSDGSSRSGYQMGLTCFLAGRYPDMRIPPVACARDFEADSCYRFMQNLRDVLWTKAYLDRLEEEGRKNRRKMDGRQGEPVEKEPDQAPGTEAMVLADAQWNIVHGKSGGGMACKGGHNGEPHNHNDVGSFLYLLGDEMLLTDLGAGEYTKQYFGPGRYEILCNSSFGHSVPILEGRGQKAGGEYGCCGFAADGKGGCEISFAGAYGNSRVRDLRRLFSYDPGTEELKVVDELESEGDIPMRENLVTQFRPEIRDGRVWIAGEKYACLVETQDREGDFVIEEKRHFSHEGMPESVYCVSWKVTEADKTGRRRCCFHVKPALAGERKAHDQRI